MSWWSLRENRSALQAAVALLLLAAVAPAPFAAGYPGPSSGPFDPHGAISITSNAGFTAANGVRSGLGTVGSPYVISGWHITSGSPAISVKGVTAAFVIRDNLVDLSQAGTSTGISVEDVQVPNWVLNNQVHYHQGKGIHVADSDSTVADNQVIGGSWSYAAGIGIDLSASNGLVQENVVSESPQAIKARGGSPTIRANNVGVSGNGILVENAGPGTNVTGNVVSNLHDTGIKLNYGSNVTIFANLVEQLKVGIFIESCVAVDVHANNVHDHSTVGIMTESCNTTIQANVVHDGKAGIQVWQSDAVVVNNTVANHLAIGIEWMMSAGDNDHNLLLRNGLGIKLQDMGIVRLRGNVLLNNTIGVDIPYVARQSIPHMRGNFVNGLNVDGSVNPAQRAYYYKAANVVVAGATFDSGFGASLYGAATAQGGLNLYEVDTARISASVFSHNRIGIYVVNSFNVQVNASLLVNNQIGVNFTVANSMGQLVPACVGFVKNTTIIIHVDPPATFGVRALGCRVEVRNSTIQNVDVGIAFDAAATGVIAGNAISRTGTGLQLVADASQANSAVLVHDNHVWANNRGALYRGSGADTKRNRFDVNTLEAIRMEAGAHPILVANNFTSNGDGVVDAQSCTATGVSCSKIVDSKSNGYYANAGRGLLVNGGAKLSRDAFVANGGIGFELHGDVTVKLSRAQGNGKSGGVVGGASVVAGSQFVANGEHGLVVTGTATLTDSTFDRNAKAGVRSQAQWLSGLHLTVTNNFDGVDIQEGLPDVSGPPAVPYPYVQPGALLASLPDGGDGLAGETIYHRLFDPTFIHRSVLTGNERDAIRVGGPAVVNATYNYWGSVAGPTIDTGVTGVFSNGVSVGVLFAPWYRDAAFSTTGPLAGL